MNKIKKSIAGGLTALLVGAGLAIVPIAAASAHTPSDSSTCNTISVKLDNYEFKAGTPAVFETRIVTPEIAGSPAVYGDAPLIADAVDPVITTEYEYTDEAGNLSWHEAGWKAAPGYTPTGAERPLILEAGSPAVYGDPVVLVPEVVFVPAATEQVETKAAVAAQDNSVSFIVDNVVVKTERFGHSYSSTINIDGTKNHTYKIVIDAIGTAYDKTLTGKTTACVVPLVEIPYPALVGVDKCGPGNDPAETDATWLATWGPFVDGPWKDGKYKTVNGQQVVDGSANIKAEFRKTHIWAGTGTKSASDFTRWRMYPGTTPYVHVDVATECPVDVPVKPADVTFNEVVETLLNCDDNTVTIQTRAGFFGHTLVNDAWILNTEPTITSDVTTTREALPIECPVEEEPPVVVDPPVVIDEPITPELVAVPAAAAAPAADVTKAPVEVSDTKSLAYTGADTTGPLLVAALLLLLGAIGLIIKRKRALIAE